MTYKEFADLILTQVGIESKLRGAPPMKLTRKLIYLWAAQAEKEIQRRYRILKSTSTVTITNGQGSLPSDYSEMIDVDGYTLVRWDEISSSSSYVYAVDARTGKIKVSQDVSSVDIYYALELTSTVSDDSKSMNLPLYEKAVEYLVLSNIFRDYSQLAEFELQKIGYQEEKPTEIEGSFGY